MNLTIIGNGVMGKIFAHALSKDKSSGFSATAIDREDKTPESDIYIFAVKPQDFTEAAKRLKGKKGKLIISIMAGIPTKTLKRTLPQNRIIRSIPNLGAKTNSSMTVWTADKNATPKDRKTAKKIFQAIGEEIEVKTDDMIDRATALSGSGPGFLYFIADQMVKTAKNFGFKEDAAQKLIRQTFLGAVKAWESSNLKTKEMQDKVTSKKGTTLAGIENFKKNKLPKILEKGLKASYKRAKELAR